MATPDGWYWVEIGDALEVVLIENGTSWAAGSDEPVEAKDLKIIKRVEPPEKAA